MNRPGLMHVVVPHSQAAPGCDDSSVIACARASGGLPALIVGNAEAERRAHTLGLQSWDRVCPALHRATLRSPSPDHGPAALVRARAPRRLVAWGTHAGVLAHRLGARLDLPVSVVSLRPHAEFPGYPACEAPPLDSREALRAELGLGPDDVAIALADDPPEAGNATRLAFIAGLLALANPERRAVALAPRGSALDDRARRFHAAARSAEPFVLLDAPTAVLWPALDIAVLTAPAPLPHASIAHASILLASGVPVVGPSDREFEQLVGPEASALLCVRSDGPQAIASALHRSSLEQLRAAVRAIAPRLAQFRAAFFDTIPHAPPAPEPVA